MPADTGSRQARSASGPPVLPFWRGRLPISAASTSWGCAPRTAAPEMFSTRNRRRPRGRKTCWRALSQIASTFRTRVGESLTTVEKHSTPLPEATTSSLDALKAYSTGWKSFLHIRRRSRVPLLERAIQIDPAFALAHAVLGTPTAISESPSGREKPRPRRIS